MLASRMAMVKAAASMSTSRVVKAPVALASSSSASAVCTHQHEEVTAAPTLSEEAATAENTPSNSGP